MKPIFTRKQHDGVAEVLKNKLKISDMKRDVGMRKAILQLISDFSHYFYEDNKSFNEREFREKIINYK